MTARTVARNNYEHQCAALVSRPRGTGCMLGYQHEKQIDVPCDDWSSSVKGSLRVLEFAYRGHFLCHEISAKREIDE